MSLWTIVPKIHPHSTQGFFNEPFFDTPFFAEQENSDGWTKVPREDEDDWNIFLLVFLLIANVAHSACDSTTNGYFCLPQQGTSGAAERLKFFNSLQFADGIIGLMRSANYWTNGVNSTLAGETDLESADLDITGSWNFSAGKLMNPKGTTLPTTDCDAANEAGRIFIDTDATTGQQLYVCEGLAGWVLSSGSGTGGSSAGWSIDGTNVYTADTIANVGIGTSIPEYTLDVSGDINADAINVNGTRVCVQGDSTCLPPAGGWTDTGTNIFTTTLTRNVGIGTSTPEATLHVAGGAIFDGSFSGMILQNGFKINGGTTRKFIIEQTGGTHDSNLRIDMDSTEGVASVDSSSTTPIDTLQLVDIDFETNGTVTASSFIGDGSALTGIGASASGWTDSGTNIYNTATSDRVAIGTTSPITGSKLHVVGTISATSFVGDGSGLTGISGGSGDGINWSSYDDITALAQTDEFLVNNSGTNKSINWQYIENNLPFNQGYMGAVEFDLNNREAVMATSSTATSIYNASTANAPISFGAWIYARSNGRGNLGEIIQKGLGDGSGKGYHMHLYAGNSSTTKIGSNVGCNDTDSNKATAADGAANGSVPLNQWVRVIATFNEDADKKMKTYVNGAEISYASNTACTGNVGDDTALDFYIGNKKDGSVTFDGYIRDAFVTRGKALTSAEVLADYKGQLPSGVTARYAFTEGIGQYVHEFYGGTTAQTGTIASSVFTQGALKWLSPSKSFIGGNLGIGTTIPTATMHIVNPLTVDTFRIDDSNGDTTPFVVTSSGAVGIGTYSPTASSKMQVVGTVTATAFVGDGSGLTGVPAASGSGGWEDGGTNVYLSATSDMVGVGTTTPNAQLMISNVGTEASFRVDDSLIDSSPFLINSVGNVGIGTTTPTQKLHVVGNARITGLVSCDTIDTDSSGNLSCGTDDSSGAGSSGWTDNGTTINPTTSTDTVGIGTTGASGSLEIVKQGSAVPLMVSSTATGDGDYLIVNSAGNVGIGTIFPTVKFQVNSSDTTVYSPTAIATANVSIVNPNTTVNNMSQINYVTGTSTGAVTSAVRTGMIVTDHTSGSVDGDFFITTKAADTLGERLRIKSAGNVGVGTVEPAALFHVGGDGRFGNGTFTNTSANEDLYVEGNLEVDGTIYGSLSGNASTVTTNANLTGDVTSSGNTATIADSVTVTGWALGASTATTPSGGDNDTSLATTAYVQTELSGLGSGGWTDGGTNIYPTLTSDQVAIGTTTPISGASLTVLGTLAGAGTGPIAFTNANVGIGTTTAPALLTVGSTGSFQIDTSGNTRVGIGTTTAGTIICVKSISSGTAVLGYCTGSLTNSICGTCN